MGDILHVAVSSTLVGIGIAFAKNIIPNKCIRYFAAFIMTTFLSIVGANLI